jgi:hypothetical protein
MKGEMAEEFAKIIQELWSGEYKYIDANNLRVSRIKSIE